MTSLGWRLLAIVAAAVVFASCDNLTAEEKVIVSETVCGSVTFVNMELGEETKIILDNSQHSDDQHSLGVVLEDFPIIITSEVPPDAQIGPTYSTVRLFALAGEKDEITVEPTLTGAFNANCQFVFTRPDGDTNIDTDLTFQIVGN